MTRQEFIVWAESKGFKDNGRGHRTTRLIRDNRCFKVSSIAVRFEARTGSGWVRIAGNYLKNLSVSDEGKLVGLRR